MSKKYLIFVVISFVLCALWACSSVPKKEDSSSALLRVKIGDKYGFINEKGEILIEPQFDNAYFYFSDDVCFATLDGRKGLINKDGVFIIELPDSVAWSYNFTKGKTTATFNNGSQNILDKNGNFIFDQQYKSIVVDKDEDNVLYYIVQRFDNKWIIANEDGTFIGEPCDSVLHFNQGLCPVKFNGKWGYMNNNGELTIDTIFDVAKVFSLDGLARVKKDNVDFYINKKGETVISVDEAVTGFDCNRAAVRIDNKLYLIDTKQQQICSIDADEIYGFNAKDSLATIIRNGKAIKIDTMGNEKLSTSFENIGPFVNGIAAVVKNDKYGIINKSGEVIIPVKYDNIFFPEIEGSERNVIVLVNKDGIIYYDATGNLIGKDMGLPDAIIPSNPTKEDFVKYFDARLSDLSPLEGIFYVTVKNYYEDRDNTNRNGLNDSKSKFYAVIKSPEEEEYWAYVADGSGQHWVNKFVRIGETNNYAIVKIDKENDYSSEGSMILDNPNSFGFRLERGHNNGYNFFVTYDFVRDYPTTSEIEKMQQAEWTGSGFAIADGYIVTNYHVTSGAKRIRVRGINGDIDKAYKAVVVASDKDHDLSIIRIVDKDFDSLGEIPYSLGKSIVDVGDEIFVLGYPMVDSMGTDIKLTEGTISSSSGFQGDKSMYQISAAVQPGNSGGPLFNEEGSVIGVVCGKHSEAENANYAIKISYLYSLLNTSQLGLNLPENKIKGGKLSKKVKEVRDFVYLIECNANN